MASRTAATSSSSRRLFTAVLPPPDAAAKLGDLLEPHQVRWPDVRWTDPAGWHFTTAFMARVEPGQYLRLVDQLTDVAAATARFDLGLSGVGAFPAPAIARALWVGAEDPTEQLCVLSRNSRKAARRAGIRTADDDFFGHLTIARFSQPSDVRLQLSVLADLTVAPWPVTELLLVESLLGQGPGGRPRYVFVERFALARH